MRFIVSFLAVVLFVAGTTAFASDTKLVTTSKNSAAKPVAFAKTIVIVASPDADLRRRAEGGLVRRMKSAVASSALMPNLGFDDREGFKAAIKASGADGVLLIRPLSISEDVTMEASEQYYINYPTLWSYWDTGMMTVTRPGAVTMEKVVTLELVVFAVADESVVWAGRLKTTNPKSLRVFLDEMVSIGSKELKRQKLM